MPKQKDLTFVTIQFTLFGVYLLPISVYDLMVPFALRIAGLGLLYPNDSGLRKSYLSSAPLPTLQSLVNALHCLRFAPWQVRR